MWRRCWCVPLLIACSAFAETNAPPGIFHGELISWQGVPRSGQFTFQVSRDEVYACAYDDHTYIERDSQRITIDRLTAGERLEIVADRKPGSTLCYARMMQALAPQVSVPGVKPRVATLPEGPLFRERGVTLSGSVSAVTAGTLLLRLRSGEHKFVRLRSDTRYFHDGLPAEPAALQPNTVVFIRATRNLRGEEEATQVIWGDILRP